MNEKFSEGLRVLADFLETTDLAGSRYPNQPLRLTVIMESAEDVRRVADQYAARVDTNLDHTYTEFTFGDNAVVLAVIHVPRDEE